MFGSMYKAPSKGTQPVFSAPNPYRKTSQTSTGAPPAPAYSLAAANSPSIQNAPGTGQSIIDRNNASMAMLNDPAAMAAWRATNPTFMSDGTMQDYPLMPGEAGYNNDFTRRLSDLIRGSSSGFANWRDNVMVPGKVYGLSPREHARRRAMLLGYQASRGLNPQEQAALDQYEQGMYGELPAVPGGAVPPLPTLPPDVTPLPEIDLGTWEPQPGGIPEFGPGEPGGDLLPPTAGPLPMPEGGPTDWVGRTARMMGGTMANNPFITPEGRASLSAGQVPGVNQFQNAFYKYTAKDIIDAMLGLWQSTGIRPDTSTQMSQMWRPPSFR